jgi:hypothetical protein
MDPDTFWDKAMKLPNRARYWYEVSTRWMQSQGAKDPEQLRRVMDMVAATSPQLQPYPNLARGVGVLAEHAQGLPTATDLMQHATARTALSPEGLGGLKIGSFSGDFQHIAGLEDVPSLSTNDRQVLAYMGIRDPNAFIKEPWLYPFISKFHNILRDAENEARPGVALAAWNAMQEMRALPDDLSVNQAKFEEQYEANQRRAMDELAARHAIREEGHKPRPGTSIIEDLFSAYAGEPLSVTRIDIKAFGTFEGVASPNMRIPMGGYRKSGGVASPNMRIPMGGYRKSGPHAGEFYEFSTEQREAILADLGEPLNQEAQAAPTFLPPQSEAPVAGTMRTYSAFIPETGREPISPQQIAAFERETGGYPLNVSRTATGTEFFLNIKAREGQLPPEREAVGAVAERVFGESHGEPHILPYDYTPGYFKQGEYQGKRDAYWNGEPGGQIRDDASGAGGAGIVDQARLLRRQNAMAKIEAVAATRNADDANLAADVNRAVERARAKAARSRVEPAGAEGAPGAIAPGGPPQWE